jgi:hypothetical protein
MAEFFKWIASLTLLEGMLYFLLAAVILAIIPYYNIITKYLKHFVYKKELKINFFSYQTITEHFIGVDDENQPIYIRTEAEEILIHNTKAIFFWSVDGAKKIDLLPVQENIKGNSAEIILDYNVLQYSIVAHGYSGEKITAEINLSLDKFYKIETTPISRSQLRSLPKVNSYPYTRNNKLRMREYGKIILPTIHTNTIEINQRISNNSKKLDVLVSNAKLRNQYKKLASSTIMKSYTFSTAKYQNLL